MSHTFGKSVKLAELTTFGTITSPTFITITRNGTICVSDENSEKVVVLDSNSETGAFTQRPELTGVSGSKYGSSVSIYGRDDSVIVIGASNASTNSRGSLTRVSYDFVSGTWGTPDEVAATVDNGLMGSSVAALDDSLIFGVAEAEGGGDGRVRHYRYLSSSFEEDPDIDTSALIGKSIDLTDSGIIVLGSPADTSNNGKVSLYTLLTNKIWTLIGASELGSVGSLLGSIVATSITGNTIAAKSGTSTVNLYELDKIKTDGETAPFYKIAPKPTTTSISVGETVSAISVTFDGKCIIVVTPTSFRFYEYRELKQTWSLQTNVPITTGIGGSAFRNIAILNTASGVTKIDLYSRQYISGILSVVSNARNCDLLLDSQVLSTLNYDNILTRGAENVVNVRGTSETEKKIIDALQAIVISGITNKMRTLPITLTDLRDVEANTNEDGSSGKMLTFSNSREKWINSGGWWEDLRFPAVESVNANIRNDGTVIRIGHVRLDPINTAMIFAQECVFRDNVFFNGDCASFIVQLPHTWLVGTELRPHVHWSQQSAISANWLLGVRVIKNGETDTYIPNETYPVTVADDGTADDVIFYRGENVFTYPGSGSFTQITSFRRFNKLTNTFTTDGIDGSGLNESSLLACALFRDKTNVSGMFPFTTAGDNPTTQDETSGTNNNDVPLYEFDVHYMEAKLGTAFEYPENIQDFSARN